MDEKCFGPVRFIPGKNRGKYPYCHSIYIDGPGILIDPASDRERLIRLKKECGVSAVWLTHWHEDHIMDLDLFDDVPLWVSQEDEKPLADLETFLDWYGSMEGEFRESYRQLMIDQFHFTPRKAARYLKGGETIDFGALSVDVIATPGHTPGHLAFYFKQPRVLLMGDYDLTKFGPWYGDLYSDIDSSISSVTLLRDIPANTWVACHETGLFEEPPGPLWDRYLDVIYKREERLLSLLETPKTMTEIIDAGIVYRRPGTKEPFFVFGEKAIMEKHLDRNIKNGSVRQIGNRFIKEQRC
jgi:glyoxylase-like metal-dependent hydrolase (beta-lactamase superfamily II)